MYQYIPEGKRSVIKYLCLGLFAGGVALFFLPGFFGDPSFPAWIPQTVAVLLLVASIGLMGRFLLRHYLYRISDDGEGLDFVVDEISRQGRYSVCRLSLSKLLAAGEWSDESKPPRGRKIYNYCVDVRPKDSWLLEFEDGEDRIYIRLSPDEGLKEYFRKAVSAREVTEESDR